MWSYSHSVFMCSPSTSLCKILHDSAVVFLPFVALDPVIESKVFVSALLGMVGTSSWCRPLSSLSLTPSIHQILLHYFKFP